MIDRIVYRNLWQEISRNKSMVFISGPRQAGKTTLAKAIADQFANSLYFNWDIVDHRSQLLQNPYFFQEVARKDSSKPLIIFDELHKYRDWKNYLKGVYDQFHEDYFFLVTGSGRLDAYQWTGDSLAGRYAHFRLWPFTLGELSNIPCDPDNLFDDPLATIKSLKHSAETWTNIEKFSGFPEPFLAENKRTYRRWSKTYSRQVIREDIRDLSSIRSISDLETLYALILDNIGSATSVPSLSRSLKVSYNTVSSWLGLFERMYLTFSITPWHKRITRGIHKERKTYAWDSPQVKNPGSAFENQVALELFRATSFWTDAGYGSYSLHYVKNKEQQEVDFVIACDGEPRLLLETKLVDTSPSSALQNFQDQLQVPAIQLTNTGETFRLITNNGQKILVAPAVMWLGRL